MVNKCKELNCSACCTKELNFEITTSPEQIKRIYYHLVDHKMLIPNLLVIINTFKSGKAVDSWGFKFWQDGKLLFGKMTFQGEKHCIYFEDGCIIYPARPLECRLYKCERLGGSRAARTREEFRMLKEEAKFKKQIVEWNKSPGTLEQFFYMVGLNKIINRCEDKRNAD